MLKEVVKRCRSFPERSKLLIMGGGYSGQHIASAARALGAEVICSRRSPDKPGAEILFDSENQIIPDLKEIKNITHLLSCIPPDKHGQDPVLSHLSEQLQSIPLKWVGYLSTTGVYGDCHGNWVNEKDVPQPQQERSKRRLACEKSWEEAKLPVQILRLPGIYGPGRSAIDTIRKGQSKMVDKPKQVFSRIHVDDIAGAVIYLINLRNKGIIPKIVNITDSLPTSNIEVLQFAGSLTGIDLPPIEPFETASKTMTPMALSFWQENRRVSNEMLCNQLGYELIHPTYKSGLRDCLNCLT